MIDALNQLLDVQALIAWGGILGITAIIFVETGLFFGFFLPGDSMLVTAGILAAAGEPAGQRVGDGEALLGDLDGGREHVGDRFRSVFLDGVGGAALKIEGG